MTVSMYAFAERPAVLYACFAYSSTSQLRSSNMVSIPPTNCSVSAYAVMEAVPKALIPAEAAVAPAVNTFNPVLATLPSTLPRPLTSFTMPSLFSFVSKINLPSALVRYSVNISLNSWISASSSGVVRSISHARLNSS